MEDYEKLGAFYLGQPFDLKSGKRLDGLVMYDAKDLVTHAVCVGMTGSGKTGLCIGLLEEALRSRIPVLILDIKGDLPNLGLCFDELDAASFLPWVDADGARRDGKKPEEVADALAT